MEMTERKKKILAAVVERYILSGEPVGSKALVDLPGLSVSSATVRNDMADLVTAGYLEQPHTSAGRIPSSEGYRHYLPSLNFCILSRSIAACSNSRIFAAAFISAVNLTIRASRSRALRRFLGLSSA